MRNHNFDHSVRIIYENCGIRKQWNRARYLCTMREKRGCMYYMQYVDTRIILLFSSVYSRFGYGKLRRFNFVLHTANFMRGRPHNVMSSSRFHREVERDWMYNMKIYYNMENILVLSNLNFMRPKLFVYYPHYVILHFFCLSTYILLYSFMIIFIHLNISTPPILTFYNNIFVLNVVLIMLTMLYKISLNKIFQ